MRDLIDTDGRPLGETRASEGVKDTVEFDIRPATYPGCREGLPVNLSALRQLTGNWDAVLNGLTALRAGFVERLEAQHRGGDSAADRWRQLFGVCVAGAALPVFLTERRVNPVEQLPSLVAGIYKVMIGVKGTVRSMMLEHVDSNSDQPPRADDIVSFAEETGRFVRDGEACAGPPHLVSEALLHLTGEALGSPSVFDPLGIEFFETAVASCDLLLCAQAYARIDEDFERNVAARDVERLLGRDLTAEWSAAPATPNPEFLSLPIAAANAQTAVALAAQRRAHLRLVMQRQVLISHAIGHPPPTHVAPRDPEYVPRYEADAALSARCGVRLTFHAAGATAQHRGQLIQVLLPT